MVATTTSLASFFCSGGRSARAAPAKAARASPANSRTWPLMPPPPALAGGSLVDEEPQLLALAERLGQRGRVVVVRPDVAQPGAALLLAGAQGGDVAVAGL